MIVVRAPEAGGGGCPYLLTPGVLIEKHYIRVAILCYKTYYLSSRGVSSESVFLPFLEFLLRGVLVLSQGMPTAGIYLAPNSGKVSAVHNLF